MKVKTIRVFIKGEGRKEYSRKEFMDALDYGDFDNHEMQILGVDY